MPDITESDELLPINASPVRLVSAGAFLDLVKDEATDGLKVLVVNPVGQASAVVLRDGDDDTLTAKLTDDRELRVAMSPAPPLPGETPIERHGSASSASDTFAAVTGATAAVTGFPANTAGDVQYTVPPGKKLKLTRLAMRRLSQNGNAASGGPLVAITAGGVIQRVVSCIDANSDDEAYAPSLEFAAGTVIAFAIRRVGGDTHSAFFSWQGVEAPA